MGNIHSNTIHKAAEFGDIPRIKFLLSINKNDINSKDTQYEATPLHYAIFFKKYETVVFLIENGADLFAKDGKGFTPLHNAVIINESKYILLLLSKKCTFMRGCNEIDNLTIDSNLNSNLISEIQEETHNLIQKNIEHTSYSLIQEKNNDGKTPLHFAAINSCNSSLLFLLNYGTKYINLKCNRGWTPLHYTCEFDKIDNLKLLILRGAKINEQDKKGWTPFHIAVRKNYKNCVVELIQSGANIFIKDNYGWDALQLSNSEEMREIIRDAIDSKSV